MKRTENAKDVFDKFASQYAEKYMDLTPFYGSFDLFCQAISKADASIFEMACGPGNVTKYLLSKRPDFQLLGTDIAPQMLKIAQLNNPNAHFKEMDCCKMDELDTFFDGVVSGFVVPYMDSEEVEKLFRDIQSVLNSGGVFYLSTMIDSSTHSEYVGPSSGDGMALLTHYYDVPFLEKRIEDVGLQIIESGFISSSNYAQKSISDWWVIARKS